VTDTNDWNAQIIEEFRANDGKVASFGPVPILILHTTGAKTGQEREHPLAYQAVGDQYAIFASKAGAPTHPAWFHNLVANPDVTIEVGAETKRARARVTEGDERNEIWERQKSQVPNFAEYEQATSREIPVIVLEPVD
jgi:deazaflavin-dependent oxidoreductase (nitroreductase family)